MALSVKANRVVQRLKFAFTDLMENTPEPWHLVIEEASDLSTPEEPAFYRLVLVQAQSRERRVLLDDAFPIFVEKESMTEYRKIIKEQQ